MRILITNDDGIDAYGLSLLADLARAYANDITIIAPADNRSGAGRSLTLKQDIHLAEISEGRFICSGTPADCVLLGLGVVMKDNLPDLVLSGINHGANVGDDIGYSGTIGAAFEAAINDIPAIAFSQDGGDTKEDFGPALEAGDMALRYAIANLPRKKTVLNVNFPRLSSGRIKGLYPCATDHHKLGDIIYQAKTPHHYRIGPMQISDTPTANSDRDALQQGYVSITPLMMDQTDHRQQKQYHLVDSDHMQR
ncbi:MAG: 5'/3'-nucleotidase SurE [Candidatus Puniceispirillaceae bacterium]